MKAKQALVGALIVIVAGFAGGTVARADTITPSLVSITGSSPFTWNYQATFQGVGFDLAPGAFFTIFDFANYVPGGETSPAGWTFSGVTTPIPSLGPDTGAPNLTWTYTGPTLTGSLLPVTFSGFSAMSAVSIPTTDDYVSQDFLSGGGPAPAQFGPVFVPVPEPSTLLVVGAGLLALAFRRRSDG